MLVNFEHRVCYLAHAKTASRATAQVLRQNSGFVPVTDHHDGVTGKSDGLEKSDVDRWWQSDWRDFVYLRVVRNPWDVIASWWLDSASHIRYPKICATWFEAFRVLHPRLFPPVDLWPFLDLPVPDSLSRILVYENVQHELFVVARFLGFPDPGELPVIGKTHGRDPDYRTYFDSESEQWVRDTFPRAIEVGGYEF